MTNKFLGNRLWLARMFQGKSMQELGDAVSTSRQYIQQIENNSKSPNEEMIAALAEALHVEPNFFFLSSENMVLESQCHFRSKKATATSMRQQAVAHGTLFDYLAEYLDETLDLPEINFPKIDHEITHPEEIERAAERCRTKWGLGIKAPITDMVKVLENAGALVTYFTGISEKIDAFSVERKRPLIIRNPAKESACRMRFDLAHECGHIVMHAGIETGDNKTESEANRFASAFLLPRAAFLNEFSFLSKSARIDWQKISELKLRWKVSIAAIIRRAYDLGLLDAIQYRNANIHLRKTGQTKVEIHDDKIKMEEPGILKSAFSVLEDDEDESLLELLNYLAIKPEFLKRLVSGIEFKKKSFAKKVSGPNIVKFPTPR